MDDDEATARAGASLSLGDPVALLDAMMEGFQVIDPELRYIFVNTTAAMQARRPAASLIGRPMAECFPGIEHTEMFAKLRECLRERTSHVMDNPFQHADGSIGHFELRIEPVPQGVMVLSIDTSARAHAEEALRLAQDHLHKAERMDALGRLSAGVAHDFNNMLSIVLGHGELALARATGPTRGDVEQMMAAARRSAELTRQLLAYGRRQVKRPTVVDPHEVVSELMTVLRPAVGETIELTIAGATDVGGIEVDAAQLAQVVMNLVLNARDALPDGGRIVVELAGLDDADGPGRVQLTVTDDGTGMDEDTRTRIFEPFFTTKERGRGSGLGLASVHGIVEQSGGSIAVRSELGEGTSFVLAFPRASERPVARPRPITRENARVTARPIRHGVLVVDDEPAVRQLIELVLRRAGYDVVSVASAEEALAACKRTEIELLLTDVMMPGMGGHELIERARALRPELRVIATSGYADDRVVSRAGWPADLVFLEKPFVLGELLQTVRAQLSD